MSVCSTLNRVHSWVTETALSCMQKPYWPGKVWQHGGHWKARAGGLARAMSLQTSQVIATLSLRLRQGRCQAQQGKCLRQDPFSVCITGCWPSWAWCLQHEAHSHRLQCLESLFSSLFKQVKSRLNHRLLTLWEGQTVIFFATLYLWV